jgi:hypothetical protein
MTLVSVVVVLTIKSYTTTAQDRPINDVELEELAKYDLLNRADTLRHRKIVDRFVSALAFDTVVSGKFTSQGVLPNPDFASYERIERIATEEELTDLLSHENPVVRAYAIQAIAVREINLDSEMLNLLTSDTTKILFIDGFSGRETRISDLVAEELF